MAGVAVPHRARRRHSRSLRQPATATLRLTHVLWLFAAVAAAEALIFAFPWWHHNMLLVGGDDTMTYEGYARDILLNGILMNGGLPPGQGEPFYYQAFYPYFLAAAHAVFGESMFGPVLVATAAGGAGDVEDRRDRGRVQQRAHLEGGAADRGVVHGVEVLAHRRTAVE